ncbi:MAG: hypothetical protein HQL75_01550 [Magnetococcales bacterium]|nr:hypothetical protein [Magnetococcales bacterium]
MFRYYFLGFVLCLLGIALGMMLLPSLETLALMHLRDQDYSKALVYFEREMEGGKKLPDSAVVPLSNLYLQNGDVDQAIAVLETFLTGQPDHIEGRKELGKLYQYAQRPMDYLANLEILHRLDPTIDVLQQLAHLYSFNADITKETKILEEMLRRYPEHASGYRDLARLLMSGGDYGRAVEVLLTLKKRISRGLDPDTMQMLIYALLTLGRKEDALAEARVWLTWQRDDRSLSVVTDMMLQGGSPTLAWVWVEELRRLMPDSLEVALQWGRVAARTKREAVAFPVLEGYFRQGRLPVIGVALLSELAIGMGHYGMATRVMATLPEGERPFWLQRALGDAIVNHGGGFVARGALETMAKKFLTSFPVLVAELQLRAGSSLEVLEEWLQRGRMATKEPEWRLRLAALLVKIGRVEEGGAMMMAMARDPQVADTFLRDLAGYFIQVKNVAGGLLFFEQLKNVRHGPRFEEARLILMVGSGVRQEACMAWVSERSSLPNDFLADIANRALDTQQLKLAEMAVGRLMAQPMNDPMNLLGREGLGRLLLLARLDLAKGQAMVALQRLKSVQFLLDEDGQRFYEEVVIASWRAKQPVRTEMMGILQSRLHTPGQGGDAESRRQYGMLALEVGEKKMGIRAFLEAASLAPPDSPEMAQLLYVLGPRPDKEALDWLLERANRSKDQDLGGWVEILTGVGAARQAVFLAGPRLPQPGSHPGLVDAYLRALAWVGETHRMEEILEHELKATKSITRLKALANLAEEKNLPKSAGAIYKEIVRQKPDDRIALKRLGYMAFYAGEWESVVGYLGGYLARYDDGYEPFFYLAEVYRSLGMVEKAKPYYLKAMARMKTVENPTYAERMTWVRMLQRVGRWAEALKGYAGLLREKPDDARLKADYVELLLVQGMSKEAQNVLQLAGVR